MSQVNHLKWLNRFHASIDAYIVQFSLDMLLNVKRHIGNYLWLAKVCLTTLIWIDQIKYTYLWIPNHMQNINSIPWLILEIKLAYSFESLLACQVCLTTTTWNDWIKFQLLSLLNPVQKNNFITHFFLRSSWITIWHHFGHDQTYLTTPTWNDVVYLLLLRMSSHMRK